MKKTTQKNLSSTTTTKKITTETVARLTRSLKDMDSIYHCKSYSKKVRQNQHKIQLSFAPFAIPSKHNIAN